MGRPIAYRNKNGERLSSVTTILSRFKESGGLIQWSFKQGQRYERGEINSLYDDRDKAGQAGTMAHSMIEASIKGVDFVPIEGATEETIAAATSAFNNYLSWASLTKLEIVEQEIPMVSELYQFAGTPDAIGSIGGKLCLLDWKSSSGLYSDMLCQIAAYKQLWEENNPDRPLTGGFHLCRFSKTSGDFAHHYYQELDLALEQFLLLLKAYKNDKVLSKRV